MNKNIAIFFLLLLFGFQIVSANIENRSFSVVVIPNIKPVCYINDNGEPDGFYIELINEIAKIKKFKIEYKTFAWEEGLNKVKKGEVDLMPCVMKTDERKKTLDFNQVSVMVNWGVLAISGDSLLEDISDLKGKTIGIMDGGQNGINFKDEINKFHIKCDFKKFKSHDDIVKSIVSGDLFGGIFFNSYDFHNTNIKQTSVVFNPVSSSYATQKGSNLELLKSIDEQLKIWKQDKDSFYYQALNTHFSNAKAQIKVLPLWFKYFIVGLFTTILLFGVWVITLKIAVNKKSYALKLIHEQMTQSQRMNAMGQLAGGIAHDFNNILGGIMGYADLALNEVAENSKLAEYLNGIQGAAIRATDLVSQILTFSRKRNDEHEPLYLYPILTEVIEMLKASIPSSVKLNVDILKDTAPILADSTKIHEVMMNLCTNAVHAMNEKGTLSIGLKEEEVLFAKKGTVSNIEPDSYLIVEISDTGTGMDSELISKIFEPFYTTKEQGKGTGLGLSVAFGIMRSHKGDIEIESIVGEGTTIRLYFPKTSVKIEQDAEQPQNVLNGTGRILFVDDEETLVKVGTEILTTLGYQVVSTTSSVEAFDLFKNDPESFDLLITDQTMPVLTGRELAEKVLKLKPNFPIILCTGFSSKIDSEIAEEIGVSSLMKKPYSLNEISNVVSKALDKLNQ
jgi:signal transduction histidine kinase/CheY-like chemotaxis protein